MRNRAIAVVIGLLVACGGSTAATTTAPAAPPTTADSGFPVSIEAVNGIVTIESRPEAIVSLSSTATEMLFAAGAGTQVVAVDEQSNHPLEAPITDLSGFTPNLEAIVAYEPDLVLVSFDPQNLVADLEQLGIPVLLLPPALAIDDAYTQIEQIGVATGNVAGAAELVARIESGLDTIVGTSGDRGAGVTFYHEVDATLYSASSASFVGQLYSLLGMENIADAADPDGLGFPQLSNEYIVDADPDVIFLADGLTLEDVSARPGWSGMSAVANGLVIPVDPDLSSRWGPRMLSFLTEVANAIEGLETTG